MKVAIAMLVLLTGCATAPITPVPVPVPVECKEDTPARPVMPTEGFTAKPAQDALLKASLAENERREGYELKLLTALQNCKAPIR